MRIGFDFDNTIVCYDAIFHQRAIQKGLIPTSFTPNRIEIRDYLKKQGQEAQWTEMQGEVYGCYMEHAEPFPGAVRCLQELKLADFDIAIVSHKTQYPIKGGKWDLHEAAKRWIHHHLVIDGQPMFREETVFFEPTIGKKLERIALLQCHFFIDDLPEIITSQAFPKETVAVLFDPDNSHLLPARPQVLLLNRWSDIKTIVGLQCKSL